MPSCFEIKCVVAVVEVCEFGKKMQVVFGIELRIWTRHPYKNMS